MTSDEFKLLIERIGVLIDKRAETTEVAIKAHISSETKASEDRIKEELRAEIVASRAEAKADNLHILGKLSKVIKSHERRLDNLEKHTGAPNPEKN